MDRPEAAGAAGWDSLGPILETDGCFCDRPNPSPTADYRQPWPIRVLTQLIDNKV